MKNILILIAVLGLSLQCFAQKTATTSDGKKVILNDNGTWKYADNQAKTDVKPVCKTKGCKNPVSKNGCCTAHQPKAETVKTDAKAKAPAMPVQCKAVVKGKRCKNTTLFPNGKCWQHGGK